MARGWTRETGRQALTRTAELPARVDEVLFFREIRLWLEALTLEGADGVPFRFEGRPDGFTVQGAVARPDRPEVKVLRMEVRSVEFGTEVTFNHVDRQHLGIAGATSFSYYEQNGWVSQTKTPHPSILAVETEQSLATFNLKLTVNR